VIAPQNAAGLGDFKKDADALERNGVCHFVYQVLPFRGNTAAVSLDGVLGNRFKAMGK
jgi:exodeoxyribonuclease VII large subunit